MRTKDLDIDLDELGVLHVKFDTSDGEILESSDDHGRELTDKEYRIAQEHVADWIADQSERLYEDAMETKAEARREYEREERIGDGHAMLERGNPSLFKGGS